MSDYSKEEKSVLQYLKSGRWSEAEQIVFEMEEQQGFCDDVLKTTRFWQKRQDLLVYTDENTGVDLFKEWDQYVRFCIEYNIKDHRVFLAAKSCILKKVIDFITKASREKDNTSKDLLVYLSYAYYEAEIYDRSIQTLEYILGRFPEENDARVYTLLGDLYNTVYAKDDPRRDKAIIMFNELFLKCPDTVDLDNIDYSDIEKLAQAARSDLFPENEVKYWVPVYGYLYGGLTVRRNLRYDEYKKLQERISDLECDVREKEKTEIYIPKLLNTYFWVFDYYVYQMKTPGGAAQIVKRVFELFAMLYALPGYDESARKLGIQADKVLNTLLPEQY